MANDAEPPTNFTEYKNSSNPPVETHDNTGGFQFTTILGYQRIDLVNLTNPAYALGGAEFLDISTLELTALGATAEISGDWDFSGIDTAAWRDLGQGGREVKSIIVERGYLFPLGHKAILVSTFERAFAVSPSGPYGVGYLQLRRVIRVTEPVKSYGAGTVGEPWTTAGQMGATDWPFQQVHIITTKTPDLDLDLPSLMTSSTQAVWPMYNAGAKDVQWTFVATDLAGNDLTMTMPLVFVYGLDKSTGSPYGNSEFATGGFTDDLCTAYHSQTTHARYSGTGGGPLQFAPESGGVAGGTTHPTLSLMIGGATSSHDFNQQNSPTSPGATALQKAGQPNFYPVIRRARIRLHSAEVLTGQDQNSGAGDGLLPVGDGVEVNYWANYVSGDPAAYGAPAAANAGAVYLEMVNTLNLSLPSSTVGGIGTPNTGLSGLSASAGAVGGTLGSFAQMAPYTDISDYFPAALDPQLLGGLKLTDILDNDNFNMPAITSGTLSSAASLVDDPTGGAEFQLDDVTTGTDASGAHTVTYTLNTPLASGPAGNPIFIPDPDGGGMLNMTAVVSTTVGAAPTYSANGSIDPFSIELASSGSDYILLLHFESLTFTSGSGQSTNVVVNLDNVEFEGCLTFVDTLEQFLQSLGLGGLAIDVEPTQVTLGLSFSLPDVQTGVFTLSGISFKIGAVIPFLTGAAVATFAFASSDNPFTLTFCCFGGGGFMSLGVGFGGLQTLQAQFEVEAQAALDIVVASGSVSLSVGIYFSYSTTGGAVLSGFVQLSGQVELLGIVTVSITMSLTLTWEITAGAVQGTATLRVGISICGFGVSIPITVSKSFGGASAPQPTTSAYVTDGGDEHENIVTITPIPGAPIISLPRAPIFRTTPITFAELVSNADWHAYCGAFAQPS